MAQKEWRELLRDRLFFALAFLLPPMMMLIFGYGMSQDVENVPFVILDYDRTRMSRDFSQHFIDSRYFQFKGYLTSERQAEKLITSGAVRFALVIPEQFQRRLYAGLPAGIQTILDGTFVTPIRTTRGYVDAVAGAAGAAIQGEYLSAYTGVPPDRAQALMQPLTLETRYLYNQPLRSIWGVAPLLIMMILMWATPMLMAVSVVREKESGAIYNIYASTITRAEYLLGKMLPIVAVSFFNALVLWLMAVLYYQAPFRGSFSCFVVAALLFAISICGLGLLVSVAVKTQIAALLVSIIVGSMVAREYSGITTPVADLTGVNSLIAHLFPAMYFTDILDSIFLKGRGWPEVWSDVLVLGGYALGMFSLGYLLFHKRVAA
jgi:ABC-2 type transport system permease protein/ribosome-dependent ATPase